MAYPIIRVSSTAGNKSDSQSSGAGPGDGITGGSKLSGTDASTDATGLIVTVPNADLTNVAVDGSHAIYLDAQANGNRRFGRIVGKANSGTASANVTVTTGQPFATSLPASQTYGIGGHRATAFLSTGGTMHLWESGAGSGNTGDIRAGWAIELADGHTETWDNVTVQPAGGGSVDGTNKLPIIVRGESGAGTKPVVTRAGASSDLSFRNGVGDFMIFRDFDVASATFSGDVFDISTNAANHKFVCMSFTGGATSGAGTRAINASQKCEIKECEFDHHYAQATDVLVVRNCFFHGAITNFINLASTADRGVVIEDSIFIENTGYAILQAASYTGGDDCFFVQRCVFDQGAGGINITGNPGSFAAIICRNNQFTHQSAWGILLNNANVDQAMFDACLRESVVYNNFFTNTSGDIGLGSSPAAATGVIGNPGLDPWSEPAEAARISGGDWSVNSDMKAQGFPETEFPGTNTRSYMDIGPQRQEPAGGGGGGFIPISIPEGLLGR